MGTSSVVERFTEAFCERITNGKGGQRIYWERKTPRFGLRVGEHTKAWFVQHEIGGKTTRITLGRYPPKQLDADDVAYKYPQLKVEEARRAAKAELVRLQAGADPRVARRKQQTQGLTLRDAFELYVSDAGRDPRTVSDCRKNLTKYLGDWLDRPLAELGTDEGRAEVNRRHRQLIADIAKGKYALKTKGKPRPHKLRTGVSTADGVMRHFRLVWNRAMRQSAALPVCPTINVKPTQYQPRRNPIAYELLPQWWKAITVCANAERRDFLRVALLTGLRSNDVKTMRWEHIDFAKKMLRVPQPKGGARRAFDLPISRRLLALLRERRKAHDDALRKKALPPQAAPWVFGSWSEKGEGHIVAVDEPVAGVPYNTHSLRHTYRQVAEFKAGVPEARVSVLMNHRQPVGTITRMYGAVSVEDLRVPAQQIEDALYKLVTPKRKA